ncbi:MAG: ThuA domain-containing protein, partial [Planctomycetaceae bacterium]
MINLQYSAPQSFARLSVAIMLLMSALLGSATGEEQAASSKTKKIVLIAGRKSHGPVGNGIHDYSWSVKLLKVMLDNSNLHEKLRVEYHLDGWPANSSTLDDADSIIIISDGRDGDLKEYEEAPHLSSEERVEAIAKQVRRGCGIGTFHFSTFAPDARAREILDWTGGYFDWETDGKRQWYSAITTKDADVLPATPGHAVLNGVEPFQMKEEFYYNMRFAADEQGVTPIWMVPALEGRTGNGNVVAWARVRKNGGRGFGTTCGHFYDNWKHDSFR